VSGRLHEGRQDAGVGVRERPPTAVTVPSDQRPNRMWRVGSLDPNVVKVLTLVGFAVPVAAYLAVIAHYQVNAISGDQWADVQVIAQNFGHFPNWSSLWSLHTDNRVFFPNLIVIALAHTVSFNIEVEEYLSALMLLAAVAMLIWAHKRRSPTTPLLFYCPVAFVLLSLAQWQNALWGFQLAWFLVLLSFAVSMFLLDRGTLPWPVLVAAILVTIVGSYSSIQGLIIWPTGLVLLYHRRRPAWAFVAWIATGLVTAAFYFRNYYAPASSPQFALHHLVFFVKFFLFALGDVVGLPLRVNGPGNVAVMAFGAGILVLAVLVVLKWGIRRDVRSGAPIGIAMIVFGLLFDALITEGRLEFGYWGASQSRYTTYDLLVLAGIYMTALRGAPLRVRVATGASGRGVTREVHPALARAQGFIDRIDRRVLIRVALSAMVIQLAFGVHYGLEGARGEQQAYVTAATLTRNINHESDHDILILYLPEGPQWIREQAAFLRKHHLSLYG
jgi:hypothetical protein